MLHICCYLCIADSTIYTELNHSLERGFLPQKYTKWRAALWRQHETQSQCWYFVWHVCYVLAGLRVGGLFVAAKHDDMHANIRYRYSNAYIISCLTWVVTFVLIFDVISSLHKSRFIKSYSWFQHTMHHKQIWAEYTTLKLKQMTLNKMIPLLS